MSICSQDIERKRNFGVNHSTNVGKMTCNNPKSYIPQSGAIKERPTYLPKLKLMEGSRQTNIFLKMALAIIMIYFYVEVCILKCIQNL